jgi:hypothetical protein
MIYAKILYVIIITAILYNNVHIPYKIELYNNRTLLLSSKKYRCLSYFSNEDLHNTHSDSKYFIMVETCEPYIKEIFQEIKYQKYLITKNYIKLLIKYTMFILYIKLII